MSGRTVNMRITTAAAERLHYLGRASARGIPSLALFGVRYIAWLAVEDPDSARDQFLAGSRIERGTPRTQVSLVDPEVIALVGQVRDRMSALTAANMYTEPMVLRACVQAWLATGTDTELLDELGVPPPHAQPA